MCPNGRCMLELTTYVLLQCSTTDRHCKCTDDVVTENCKISIRVCFKCQMFSVPYCIICDHLVGWHSKSTSFHCRVCFVLLFLSFLCEVTPKHSIHAAVKHPVNVCVFMFCHFIDVNWRLHQCSQSESWPSSGIVTIPLNVHRSD